MRLYLIVQMLVMRSYSSYVLYVYTPRCTVYVHKVIIVYVCNFRMYVCMGICTYVRTYVRTSLSFCVCSCLCVSIHACMLRFMSIRTYENIIYNLHMY